MAMVRPVLVSELGISAKQLAGIVAMREAGEIKREPPPMNSSASSADRKNPPARAAGPRRHISTRQRPGRGRTPRGMLIVRDERALDAWRSGDQRERQERRGCEGGQGAGRGPDRGGRR